MIIEYYDEIGRQIRDLYPKHVRAFEEYIREHQIPQEEVYDKIPAFTDTLPVMPKTRRKYRGALRNYIETINKEEGGGWI